MATERDQAPEPQQQPGKPPAAVDGATGVLALQRAIGNRATRRLLARDGPGLTLDPRFMPAPPDYQLTPPTLQTPFTPPSHVPPIPDLHDKQPSLSDRPRADGTPNLWDFRHIFGPLPEPPTTVTLAPDPPAVIQGDKPDEPQVQAGGQWTWSAGKAKPDRSVQLQFQQGNLVIQGSVNVDTGELQWMAGAQPQASTKEIKVLGALVSAQAFLSILGGVTVDGGAGGVFTVQAAVGLQLTIKWGPITVQLQAGPQIAWTPKDGWSSGFSVAPGGGGPSDVAPGGPGFGGLPPMKGWFGWTWHF